MINKFGNFFLKTCQSSLDMTCWKSSNRKMFAVPQGEHATNLSRKGKREDALEENQPKLGKSLGERSSKKMNLYVSMWNFQQVKL